MPKQSRPASDNPHLNHVIALIVQGEKARDLCGWIVATLRANFDLGTLTATNQKELLALLESWERQLKELQS